MADLINPFAPGAGTRPPELAGRNDVLEKAEKSFIRAKNGLASRSLMLLGLRGTGKTVLLNEIKRRALNDGIVVSKVEAPENVSVADLLYPEMGRALRTLSNWEVAKDCVARGLKGLRNFASSFKIKVADVEVSIDPEYGLADSGDIEYDLPDMVEAIGLAAAKAKTAWLLLIDEVQYLKSADLSALIVSMHRVAQEGLPVVFIGAGLPQIAKLAGEAKSYSERLFLYQEIGPLSSQATTEAVTKPLETWGRSIEDKAINEIVKGTQGYPFFIQAWAYQACEVSNDKNISFSNVLSAYGETIAELDQGFFRVRYDRLTDSEVAFVQAMASLGSGPYKSKDIAQKMNRKISSLSPIRSSLIKKGMIYSQKVGELAFTVPLFSEFVQRNKI